LLCGSKMIKCLICKSCSKTHQPPNHHPENPLRIKVLQRYLYKTCREVNVGAAVEHNFYTLYRVHDRDYVENMLKMLKTVRKPVYLDEDTYIEPTTIQAVKETLAVLTHAVELLTSKQYEHVVALVRPPSHHAGRRRFGGFCIFNLSATATAYLLDSYDTIAVVDFDAHYGDGFAEIFYEDDRVLYISLHEDPRYMFPYRGFPEEAGRGKGLGYTVNIVMPVGATDKHYRRALNEIVQPLLKAIRPKAVVVLLGLDTHRKDELTDINATLNIYAEFGKFIQHYSPSLTILEGGYNLWVLPRGIANYIAGLEGREQPYREEEHPIPLEVDRRFERFMDRTRKIVRRHLRIDL